MILGLLLVIVGVACLFSAYECLKARKKAKALQIYEDIVKSVLTADFKVRKNIEKQCNEYLEHKVINSKSSKKEYLEQCNLILDDIKYLNMISSIEPIETKEDKQVSKIEKAIAANIEEETEKRVKSGKSKKEEKA